MKSAIILCVLAVVAMSIARPDGDKYTDRYDSINLDEILANKKVLDTYFNCITDKGKCTAEAKELKEHIKDALESECGKCTEKQKDGSRRVIKHLINKEPAYWTELSDKYDPGRKYTTKYEKELKEVAA